MSHIHGTQPPSRRWPLLLAGCGLLALAAVTALLLVNALQAGVVTSKGGSSPSPSGNDAQATIRYANEKNSEILSDTVNAPLELYVVLPADDKSHGTVFSVSVEMLDESDKPAYFGDNPAGPLAMRPSFEPGSWIYLGSVPSKPGIYHAVVQAEVRSTSIDTPLDTPTVETRTSVLTEPALTAIAESGPPLTAGYVFERESNLWLLSQDTRKQRRLTFFSPPDEYAEAPSWSPDGNKVAFGYAPPTDMSTIPTTEIWETASDGHAAHRLVERAPGESLSNPTYSADGRYIYFSVEVQDVNGQPIYSPSGAPVSPTRIDKIDLATGQRTQWAASGTMPSVGGPSGSIVYVQTVIPEGADKGVATGARLLSVSLSGQSTVLLENKDFPLIYNPRLSPNGKWVIFSSINFPRSTGERPPFDVLGWLLMQPDVAEAHGLPWDIYIMSAQGGTPARITHVNEDQPVATWLNDTAIALIGTSGLYTVEITSDGQAAQKPIRIYDGVSHSGLAWHPPREAKARFPR